MIRLSILDGLIHNFAFHQQQQHHLISSISASAASAHEHQCISSISASAASAHQQHQQHQCIGYRHWKIYLPIYIKLGHISLYPLTSPDELQTPPDMLQTPSDMVKTPPDTTTHASCMVCMVYSIMQLR